MPSSESPKTSLIVLPFAQGMDEKTAEQYLDPAASEVVVVNGQFNKIGALDKRLGLDYVPNTNISGPQGQINSAIRAGTWSRTDTLIASPEGLYVYDDSGEGTISLGPLPQIQASRTPLVTTNNTTNPVCGDFTYNGRILRCVMYLNGSPQLSGPATGTIMGMVYDVETGDIIAPPTAIYSNTNTAIINAVQVINLDGAPIADSVICVVVDYGYLSTLPTNPIWCIKYNPVTNTFGSAVGLALTLADLSGLVGTVGCVDVKPWYTPGGTATQMVFCYYSSHTSCDYAVYDYTLTLGASGNLATFTWNTGSCFVWASKGESEHVWFCWGSTNSEISPTLQTYQVAIYKGDGSWTRVQLITAQSGTDFYAWGGVVRASATTAWFILTPMLGGDPRSAESVPIGGIIYLASSGPNTLGPGVFPGPFFPLSNPFMVNGQLTFVALLFCSINTLQAGIYTLSYNAGGQGSPWIMQPSTCIAPRQVCVGLPTPYGQMEVWYVTALHIPQVAGQNGDGTNTYAAFGFKVTSLIANEPTSWIANYAWDSVSQNTMYQMTELGGELHITSGVPLVYDGAGLAEENFFLYPEALTISAVDGDFTGTLGYAVIYARVDATGLTHRSAPVFVSIALTNQYAQLNIPPYNCGYYGYLYPQSVVAEIYRTTLNGGIWYYETSVIISDTVSTLPITWPASGGDSTPDSSIDTNPQIYTTGGVLDAVNAPAANGQCLWADRVFTIDDTLQSVWFTQQYGTTEVGQAPYYNDQVLTFFYPDGGPITAIASMDNNFIAFKQNSIWVATGTGGAPNGAGSTYSNPQQIPSPVGCTSQRSIVLIPDGLMFQGPDNNIYILTRGLQVQWIGKNVVDILQAFPQCQAATWVPGQQQVRFVMGSIGNTDLNSVVVYDYYLQKWYLYSYVYLSAPIAAAYLTYSLPQTYTIVTTDGKIWQESENSYFDQDDTATDNFVTTVVASPYLHINGAPNIQDNQRARLIQFLGQQNDSCGLNISYVTDQSSPLLADSQSWSSEDLSFLENPGQVMLGVSPNWSRCQWIQIAINDVAGTSMSSGAGMRFINVAVELQSLGRRWNLLQTGARR